MKESGNPASNTQRSCRVCAQDLHVKIGTIAVVCAVIRTPVPSGMNNLRGVPFYIWKNVTPGFFGVCRAIIIFISSGSHIL